MNPDFDVLRRRLRAEAILHTTDEKPIRTRDGHVVDWMFYSWGVSLTSDGVVLAARCVLDVLQSFRGTQLATHGFTAMPLLAACIIEGRGRYSGLAIRTEQKKYGSCRRIEGHGNVDEPVIVIDDSISSGSSLENAITALEAEGYTVEGAICLVNFPFRGGVEWARGLGYRVETLFDIWNDLEMPNPPYTRGLDRIEVPWEEEARCEDGLPPAVAARRIAQHFARSGRALLPPRALDRDYDARGGVFVSFRERDTEHRLERGGLWHFDPADADLPRDLVLATVSSMQSVPAIATKLEQLKIGVSFLGPFEAIGPADLDYDRYGIAVRSHVYHPKTGGALPNTQAFVSEYEQYRHARYTNARITLFEPHDLFRYEVTKHVEPGESWLPYGSIDERTWMHDATIGARLLARAREVLENRDGQPLPADLIPQPVHGVAVTLWNRGPAGCRIAWEGSLDDCLVRATRGALEDDRFTERLQNVNELTISVSLLHDPEHIGEYRERAEHKLRRGLDSIAVRRGECAGILLSYVAVHHDWDKEEFGAAALEKAGLTERDTARWTTLPTTTWLESRGRAAKLSYGYPERDRALGVREGMELLAGYILRQLGPNGLPAYCYYPTADRTQETGSAARIIHACRALASAGRLLGDARLESAGRDAIAQLVDRLSRSGGLVIGDHTTGPMAECQLLLAVAQSGVGLGTPGATMLAGSVRALFHRDGAVSAGFPGRQIGEDHDFLPGAAILALGHYAAAAEGDGLLGEIDAQFRFYARRFRQMHPWGMVGWHPQAWSIVHQLTGRAEYAELAFEIADWAIAQQLKKSGAFLADCDPSGPSFHTGFLAEGVAAAWSLARQMGEGERAARYERSAREAWRFVQRLVITDDDLFCMPDGERSRGGVRSSQLLSLVRIDFVSHVLDMLATIAAAEGSAVPSLTTATRGAET